MSQINDVKRLVNHYNGIVPIDDGNMFYVVTQVNDSTFDNLPDQLKEQLKSEGKTNYYVAFITSNRIPFSIDILPIYGSADKFVTKWFYYDMDEAIQSDLRDKWMGLYKRIKSYEPNIDIIGG